MTLTPIGIPPALTARLAPGKTILLHHRPDRNTFLYWQRVFLLLVGGMIVTAQRILWATVRELRIVPGLHARAAGNHVLIHHRLLPYKLFYPADKATLAADLNRIFQSVTSKGQTDG